MLNSIITRSTITRPQICGSLRLFSSSLRSLSTLSNNPHIYIHPSPPTNPSTYQLSLLTTTPPHPLLTIGSTPTLPLTPDSFIPNPNFLSILNSVLSIHAIHDPSLQSQAAAFASTSGSSLGSGGQFFPSQPRRQQQARGVTDKRGDGAGGASSQGGAGGGGRGGWVHLSDERAPPDYGRIAWPEDIFGSVEVDGQGKFVGENGNWQSSGSYRVVTREGVLGLSEYLRGKVVERLREEEDRLKREGV